MRTIVFVVLAFAATFVATFAIVVSGTLTYWELAGIHDRDGGGAMGLFFIIGPTVATLAAVIAATVTAVRMIRRSALVAAGNRPPPKRWSIRVRALIAALAWAAAVYAVIAFIYWLAAPIYFQSYAIAVVVAWLPATGDSLIQGRHPERPASPRAEGVPGRAAEPRCAFSCCRAWESRLMK